MKIIQAIEVEYFATRALHSEGGDFGGRLFATSIVAGQFLPVLLAFFDTYQAFSGELRAVMAYVVSFVLMYILTDRRRDEIAVSYGQPFVKFDQRAKLYFAAFLILSTLVTAVVAAVSPFLALVTYGVLALVPLQRWVKPIGQ